MSNLKFYLLALLFILLAIGIGIAVARYQREIHATRAALGPGRSQVVETACGPVEYARAGHDQGYPVLVAHGDMGGFDQGLLAARPLIDAGYQVIAVSRFGYLRSPMPENASLNMQADTFACLLDALDIRQAAVLGISAGATSSIRFVARHPERVSALILLSPAAPGDVEVASPPRAIFDTLMRSDFIYWAMITYFKPLAYTVIGVPKGFGMTPAFQAEANRLLAATLPLSARMDGFIYDTYDPQLKSEFYQSVTESSPYPLDKIETPVLLINAGDDPYANPTNVRRLAEKFPHARLFVVPDGGHLILGHAADVDAQMSQFLSDPVAALSSRP